MSNVLGARNILLQPNDLGVGITIRATVCSSATANDGFLAWGTTVSGVVTHIYNDENEDVTSELLYSNPTISGSGDIKISLKYPTSQIEGRYKLEYVLLLSDGSQKELTFHRIYAKDL